MILLYIIKGVISVKDYLKVDHVIEEKINIDNIPALLFQPKNKTGQLHTIILYHGWSSSKESQRIRAFILCSLGYQVVVPDAIHHGERGLLDYADPNNVRDYFWSVVFKNINESGKIIDYTIKNNNANKDTITVLGHSMGGFTSAGIFTHNPMVKAMVVINGSCNWSHTNSIFKENPAFVNSVDYEEIEEKIESLDPMNNLDKIINRPILILHGEADNVVPIGSQHIFYEKLKPMYSHKEDIDFIQYPNLGHFVTTNMMEQVAIWLQNILIS